ncbi:MAG: TonB-dependent receptor [Pseudomonadales bacterium]|nr:TonB-dependent receptor [Pseudomonadales bacterium]
MSLNSQGRSSLQDSVLISSGISRWLLLVLAVLMLMAPIALAGPEEDTVHFDIQAQPVGTALLEFAQQAQVPILFPSGNLNGIKAKRLTGEYRLDEALKVLLTGTGIEASITANSGQIVVRMVPDTQNNDLLNQRGKDMATKESTPVKKSRNFLISALSAAISAVLAGAPGAADAQQQGADTDAIEEIAVTGSRIRQTSGFTTPTPVTAVTTDELQTFDPASSVAEQLDALPQFFQTQTAQRGGGTLFGDASGSFLNLRGMGKQRTLVLLDGSRIVPADRAGAVNVDNFPTALVRTVDVVTGGASAAYGADAMAGVVNFVLDREFEGFKVKASSGINEEGDGENVNFSFAGGRQIGERLHLIGSLEGRHVNDIVRDPDEAGKNFQRWGFVTNPDWFPGAPAGIPRQLTLPDVHSTVHTPGGLINQPGFSLNRFTFTPDGQDVRPFVLGDVVSLGGPGATQTQSGGPEAEIANQAFDSGLDGNEVEQRSGFIGLQYDVSENFKVFGQALLGRTESNSFGRRGLPHLQTNTWFGTVFAENAFLPDNVRQAMIDEGLSSIRIDKLGQLRGPDNNNWFDDRDNKDVARSWSASGGFDAVLPNGWDLRASFQHGDSKVTSAARKILRIDKFFLAMDAVVDPASGEIVCNIALQNPTPAQLKASVEGQLFASPLAVNGVPVDSPIGTDIIPSECVPINVFGDGNVSQAAADYVVSDEKKGVRSLNQEFAEMLLTGEVFDGFGAGPVSFAAGFTYRHESFAQFSLPLFAERGVANAPELGIRGIPQGFTGPGNRSLNQFSATGVASGSFDVWEVFSELNIPVWESASGGQRLALNGAYRSSDYSTSGRVGTWKVGGDIQVVNDLRIRVTRSRDVREPNFAEQFEAGGGGGTVIDPVFNDAIFSITSFNGFNPVLAPEEAKTITTGMVYQPTFAPWIEGFQVSADWYIINLSGAVGQLGAQRIVDDCFDFNIQELCSLITRDADTNIVLSVFNKNFNIGGAKTEGVDIEVQYSLEPDLFASQNESLTLRGFAGRLIENSTSTADGAKTDAVGGLNRPKWTANVTANYNVGPYGIQWQQRYYDSTLINVNWVEGVDVDDNTIASQSISNLALSYNREFGNGGNWRAVLNITNLFDREPPVVPSISQRGGSQTFSDNFDIFGRRYQLSLNMTF